MNSSLFKVDVVVYPELYLKNPHYHANIPSIIQPLACDRGLFSEWDEADGADGISYIMMDMVLGRVRFTRAWLPFSQSFSFTLSYVRQSQYRFVQCGSLWRGFSGNPSFEG